MNQKFYLSSNKSIYIEHDDVLKFTKNIQNESVDLIIADPPYFKIYGKFDFYFKNEKDYLSWCEKWLKECRRILKNDGTLMLWGSVGKKTNYICKISYHDRRKKIIYSSKLDYSTKHKGYRNKE